MTDDKPPYSFYKLFNRIARSRVSIAVFWKDGDFIGRTAGRELAELMIRRDPSAFVGIFNRDVTQKELRQELDHAYAERSE